MIVRDWRDADPADVQVLYAREQEYWVRELAWDASTAWRDIEQARVTWGLPGYMVVDTERAVRGWAYYLPEGDTLHLGGVVADTPQATGVLLDACLQAADRPPRPARVACFLPNRARGFTPALVERGFSCERYHYLARGLGHGEPVVAAEPWTPADVIPAATLLREAYGEEGGHFAPGGTPAEWETYVRSLVERPGCGVLDPTLCRVVHGRRGLDALVLVTRIAPGTLHLPQVAVHPTRRRAGLARALVEDACRLGAARGAKQVTLLVGDHNPRARALYDSLGFSDRSEFVAAARRVSGP